MRSLSDDGREPGETFMLGFNRWHAIAMLAAILCITGLGWLALAYFIPTPPSKITIAGSFKGGH